MSNLKEFSNNLKSQVLPPQKKNPVESKKNYETFWKIIFILITIFSAFLINKVYLYQTQVEFEPIRKGNAFELFFYGSIFGIIFIYFETLVHSKFDEKCEQHYLGYERYQLPEVRKKRAYTLVKWAYTISYYAVSSTAAYVILKDTSFMPTWLGGNGYCTDLTRYLLNMDEANIQMKVFYIIQFGKHIGRFMHHVFIRSEGNFYEYTLHHGLSTFLIFFSYLMNMWLIGIFVLFIHDFSDFFLILGRAYRDYKNFNRSAINLIYYCGAGAWVGCRILLLSYCCVYSSISSAYEFFLKKEKYSELTFDLIMVPGIFMAFMLFALQVLQIFWTYYILQAFVEIGVSSKLAKNTYEA